MAEIDRHIVELVSSIAASRATQEAIMRSLEEVRVEIRGFQEATQQFYRDPEGWPKVVKLDDQVAQILDRLKALETQGGGRARRGLSLPSIPQPVREAVVPAGMTTALLGAGWLVLQGLSALGAWVQSTW